ncbi:MAG TPA: signal peptidase II [Nitrospiria bacterium]|nr:signal peptidase II [Nitrospiria bacterium]
MNSYGISPPARLWRPGLAATIIAAILVVSDQATKVVIQRTMMLHETIPVMPSVSLTYTRNPGAAFSLLADAHPTFRAWFFLAVSVVALILIAVFLRRVERGDWWSLTALSLILGGAIGNLLDRVRYGEVVDFIDLYVGQYHWPVFNVADSGITVGMLMLLGHALLHRQPDVRPAADP